MAALAKKLKDTPDVTGTMLDNTAIVFVMEAGLGNTSLEGGTIVGERPPHTSEGMAAVVVGGKRPGHAARDSTSWPPASTPPSVSLTAMRAVGGAADRRRSGEITAEIAGLRG